MPYDVIDMIFFFLVFLAVWWKKLENKDTRTELKVQIRVRILMQSVETGFVELNDEFVLKTGVVLAR